MSRKVLLIHPFGIGDALFITPAIRELNENGYEIDLLLGSRTKEIFQPNRRVRNIYEWDKTKPQNWKSKWQRIVQTLKLFVQLNQNRYDISIDFTPTGQYGFYSFWVFWIPTRIGFNFKNKGFFLTHKLPLTSGYGDKSIVEYYLDTLSILKIQTQNKRMEMHLTAEDEREAESALKTYCITDLKSTIAISPGGGESWGKDARLKRWPVSYFATLIDFITKERNIHTVLILGGSSEVSLGNELSEQVPGKKAINLCGQTSVRAAAALLKKVNFFVGNDGGLTHLAHTMGAKVVSIYGPVDPNVYGPYPKSSSVLTITNEGPACRPCYQLFRYQKTCKGLECLSDLTPEMVFNRMKEFI